MPASQRLRLLIALALAATAPAIQPLTAGGVLFAGRRVATLHPYFVAAAGPSGAAGIPEQAKPPGLLKLAYSATGIATTGAWSTVVWTTIRSNQPLGAMMPSVEHGLFARMGALSAVPLIASCFAALISNADSWESLGSETCRRLNLALVTAGVGSALWVGFAPIITRIPQLPKVAGRK